MNKNCTMKRKNVRESTIYLYKILWTGYSYCTTKDDYSLKKYKKLYIYYDVDNFTSVVAY